MDCHDVHIVSIGRDGFGPEPPALTEDEMDASEAYIVSVEEGGANFYYVDDPLSGNGTDVC